MVPSTLKCSTGYSDRNVSIPTAPILNACNHSKEIENLILDVRAGDVKLPTHRHVQMCHWISDRDIDYIVTLRNVLMAHYRREADRMHESGRR